MSQRDYLVDVMSTGQKFVYNFLVLIWLGTLIWFWSWWLSPVHLTNWFGLFITSFVAGYQTIIPIWFFWFAAHAKKPNPNLPIPSGRVAMLTTKTPSEPWEMVERTLVSMLHQEYPGHFDVWLADEDPTQETKIWCQKNGVGLASRKGIPEYNRKSYPGQTKTKEGNTLFWYETVGYDNYDFVVQMDVDHAPMDQHYLKHMIAPFIDPKVGMVAAPSLNDHNANESWAVRGRFHTEAVFHGLMQAGYAAYGSSMGIGSHYAVRTVALKMGGGPGPTRAEDASTTLFINAAGYDSIFAFDAWASGDGPGSFGSLASQEIQWSSSLMRILIEWMPKKWHNLNLAKKIIFLFSQSWYPSYGSHLIIGSFLPAIAIAINIPWMQMNYIDFLFHWWTLVIACILPIWFVKSQGFFKPKDAPLISWEGILFQITRWPWVVVGCLQGIGESLTNASYTFKVTPKGKDKEKPLGFTVLLPYLLLVLLSGVSILFLPVSPVTNGYRWLALLDIFIYSFAVGAIIRQHNKDTGWTTSIGTKVSNFIGICIILTAMITSTFATRNIIPIMVSQENAVKIDDGFVYAGVRDNVGPTATPTMAPAPISPLLESFGIATETPEVLPIVTLDTTFMISGLYDPSNQFGESGVNIRHQFTDWNNPGEVDAAISDARKHNQFPMITMQPYHRPGYQTVTLLDDISNGAYDDVMTSNFAEIKKNKPQYVIVRAFHEMDLCEVYEWSICNPEKSIAAYRHMIDLARTQGVDNVIWMWSPNGGIPNTYMFYPGDEYVDVIGITGLVAESWDRFYGIDPQPQPFAKLFNQRYPLATQFNKPLMIAELGISYDDPKIDRAKWLNDAITVMNDREKYPFFIGWVYYNAMTAKNPHINLLPDFRLTKSEFENSLLEVK